MLAGLGQIHIDATVGVSNSAARERGAYGGFTSIEEVEPAVAEGIAAALTGQE